MEQKLTPPPREINEGPAKTIVLTGLIAGTLDAIAAIVVSGSTPVQVFQYIASGAFGAEKAFSGGLTMVIWGVVFHYFIAFSWTILFFFLFPTISFLRKNEYITGLIYGIFVWTMMKFVVLPFSKIPQSPFNLKGALIGASILMVMIGLPISILTHRYYSKRKGNATF